MEKTELVEMERLESIKMIPHRLSGKQIEARITAATLILGTIVLNILWWAGIQFMETDNSREITQKVQPIEHRITQNGLARH